MQLCQMFLFTNQIVLHDDIKVWNQLEQQIGPPWIIATGVSGYLEGGDCDMNLRKLISQVLQGLSFQIKGLLFCIFESLKGRVLLSIRWLQTSCFIVLLQNIQLSFPDYLFIIHACFAKFCKTSFLRKLKFFSDEIFLLIFMIYLTISSQKYSM